MSSVFSNTFGRLPWLTGRLQRAPTLGEPERAVQQALSRLRQLSMAGAAVADDIKLPILAAQQEILSGNRFLSSATGPAFYEACRRLATLTARMDADDDRQSLADPFERAIVNSELLLKFASENGTPVPAEVQAALIAGQATLGARPNEEVKSKFYAAYAKLAQLLGEVTADTIKACRSARTQRRLMRDRRIAVCLACATAIVSMLLFISGSVDKQLAEDVSAANDLAIKLRGIVIPPASGDAAPIPLPADYTRPCTKLTSTPQAGEFAVRSQTDLNQIQSFAIALRDARTRAARLNGFIAKTECDPFGKCWWGNVEHNRIVDEMSASTSAPSLRDRFELQPSLVNFTAEFLCKVQTWQDVRNFATNVQRSYEATSGGLVAHALPILYALLGAYAFRLRQFGDTIRKRTYHPSFADSARLITAVIAGAVAGLFNTARELAISPLAAAFLVGYGVDIFFRFLDASLQAFGAAAPAVAKSRPAAGIAD